MIRYILVSISKREDWLIIRILEPQLPEMFQCKLFKLRQGALLYQHLDCSITGGVPVAGVQVESSLTYYQHLGSSITGDVPVAGVQVESSLTTIRT